MKHLAYTLLLLTCTLSVFGQSKFNSQKIANFKNGYMDKVELYTADTLKIDTLMFVREKLPELRLVKTYVKNRNVVHYDYYHSRTTQLQSSYVYDTLERPINLAKEYTSDGKLDYTKDYDKGEWIVYNKMAYPFYEFQNGIRAKADSLIGKMYGFDFLKNNTVWCIDGSVYNSDESGGDWTDKIKTKPSKFLIRYNVKLDDQHIYDELIEFSLDSNGTFIPNEYEDIYGFEDVPETLRGSFKLSYFDALLKAKSLGLEENDTAKAVGSLRWENFKKPTLINGQFRFYITIKTKIIENVVPNGRSSRTTKYDVYSFNPWTGDFIEKKKMKSIYSWEQLSGSGTGLISDN